MNLTWMRQLWTAPTDQYMSAAWLSGTAKTRKHRPAMQDVAKSQLRAAWAAVRETFRWPLKSRWTA